MKYLQLINTTNIEALEKGSEYISTFTKNPIDFLLEQLTLYYKGQDIIYTPIRYIYQGQPLYDNYPFFVIRSVDTKEVITPLVGGKTSGNIDETQDKGIDLKDETNLVEYLGQVRISVTYKAMP